MGAGNQLVKLGDSEPGNHVTEICCFDSKIRMGEGLFEYLVKVWGCLLLWDVTVVEFSDCFFIGKYWKLTNLPLSEVVNAFFIDGHQWC